MLVDNKFIYLSLPRCASTSFHATCLQMGIDIKDYSDEMNKHLLDINLKDKSIDWLADNMRHGHYSIYYLQQSYGKHLPIISVNRNRYERFISLWKHCIDEMYRNNEVEIANLCSKLDYTQILNFNSDEISNRISITKIVKRMCYDNGISNISDYALWGISTCITPYSFYHHHNPNIIWFDFTNLTKMEEWVSEKLGIDFKLGKGNSSNHYECKLKLTDTFVQKYNSIYDMYDLQSSLNKLI